MPGTGEDVSGAGGGCAEMGRNTKQPESWNLGKSRKRESARVTGREMSQVSWILEWL